MAQDPNNINADARYRTAVAERGKFWEVDSEYLESIGYPASGDGKYAVLTYSVNGSSTSGDSGSSDPYQNSVINGQITLTGVEQAVTLLAGDGYVKLRISPGGSCHIGGTGVTTSNGYLLDDAYPVEALTFDDLTKIFVIGSGTLYVIGGRVV